MIPQILAEELSIYRIKTFDDLARTVAGSEAATSLRMLPSADPTAQISSRTDSNFYAISVLLLNRISEKLGAALSPNQKPLIDMTFKIVTSPRFAQMAEDPLTRISTFMHLFAHEYAHSILPAPRIPTLIAGLRRNGEFLDMFELLLKTKRDSGFVNQLETNLASANATADLGDFVSVTELNRDLSHYLQRVGSEPVPPILTDKNSKILKAPIFLPELWFAMIQKSIIKRIQSSSFPTPTTTGMFAFNTDAIFISAADPDTHVELRPMYQKRSLLNVEVKNMELRLAVAYNIKPMVIKGTEMLKDESAIKPTAQ